VRGPPGDLPAEGKPFPFPFPCRKHQAEPRINPFCAASFSVKNGNRSYRCALRRPRIVVAHVCSSPKSPAPTPDPRPLSPRGRGHFPSASCCSSVRRLHAVIQMQLDEHARRLKKLETAVFSK